MLATLSTPRVGSSCLTSQPLLRPSTSQPPGRSTREAVLTASLRPGMEGTEETVEIVETEEVDGEEVEVEEETTGGPAHLRGTGMMTGTGGVLPTVAGMIITILPAVEVVMTDGVVDLLAGAEGEVVTTEMVGEVEEVEDTTMMTTVATMITATVGTAGEITRKINFQTIWNISCLRTTLWLPGRCSSETWSST